MNHEQPGEKQREFSASHEIMNPMQLTPNLECVPQ